MEEKTYVIWGPERLELTESELTQQDLDLFFGNLINTYKECPPKVKDRFLIWYIFHNDERVHDTTKDPTTTG